MRDEKGKEPVLKRTKANTMVVTRLQVFGNSITVESLSEN